MTLLSTACYGNVEATITVSTIELRCKIINKFLSLIGNLIELEELIAALKPIKDFHEITRGIVINVETHPITTKASSQFPPSI